ncbi:hypothetical protein Tco_0205237 [Tanacetum coccineum]
MTVTFNSSSNQSLKIVSSTKPSSLVTPPPINTECFNITTSLPEITPFIALQLRVERLEQEMSEVKKTDHSAAVLASIKSQVLCFWVSQPPPKDDDQSSKKPRESDASASKQHPALTSTGWQITDTRDAVVDSSMHRSDPEFRNLNNLQMTSKAGRRASHRDQKWTIPPNDFPEPENNWANTYATTYQVPAENKLQMKTYDIRSFIKWFCRTIQERRSSEKLI